MHLTELKIRDLRCLAAVDLQLSPGLNFIVGDNGSGKTSLLEAVHILSRGRSFRNSNNQRLVRENENALTVFGRVADQTHPAFTMGVQRDKEALQFKLSHTPSARTLDMLRALPVQVISPDLHILLERGPTQRRRFMDWGVFHVEQDFHSTWQRYQRALQQRNAALRHRKNKEQITIWDGELSATGQRMDELRRQHVVALVERLKADGTLEVGSQVGLDYHRGWVLDQTLDEVLDSNLERDQQRGYTTAGPHRADLRLQWEGRLAADVASRGEQKLLICTLLLLQARMVAEQTGSRPILLVDDLAAELGAQYRQQFIAAIEQSGLQALLTFLERKQIPEAYQECPMFHVKHGEIQP